MSGSWRTGSSVAAHNQRLLAELGVPFKFFIHTWDENIATFRSPIDTVYAHHWFFSLREPVFESLEPKIHEKYVLSHYPNATVKIEVFSAEIFSSKFYFNFYSILVNHIVYIILYFNQYKNSIFI